MRSTLVHVLLLATTVHASLLSPALADPADARSPSTAPLQARAPAAAAPRVEVVDEATRPLPSFFKGGRRFVLGAPGERYAVRIVNPTAGRVEAVVSIDGLDAIDGRPAGVYKRGYLVPAFGEITIEGWRTSLDAVAAFRFSSVRASYAALTGHDRNVGVIGAAFFRERPRPAWSTSGAEPPRSAPAAERPSSAPPAGRPAARSADAQPAPPSGEEARAAADTEARPGLGTEFGERRDSYADEAPFERASARPDFVTELRYDDRDGLLARGIRVPPRDARDEENALRDRAEPFPVSRFARPPSP